MKLMRCSFLRQAVSSCVASWYFLRMLLYLRLRSWSSSQRWSSAWSSCLAWRTLKMLSWILALPSSSSFSLSSTRTCRTSSSRNASRSERCLCDCSSACFRSRSDRPRESLRMRSSPCAASSCYCTAWSGGAESISRCLAISRLSRARLLVRSLSLPVSLCSSAFAFSSKNSRSWMASESCVSRALTLSCSWDWVLKRLRFSASAIWHLRSRRSHSISFSRLSSKVGPSGAGSLGRLLLLTGVSSRLMALSKIFMSFCSPCVFFSGLMVVWEQMFLMKNLVEAYSFSSSRLREREWVLLRLKRFSGPRRKECMSLKKEVSSSLLDPASLPPVRFSPCICQLYCCVTCEFHQFKSKYSLLHFIAGNHPPPRGNPARRSHHHIEKQSIIGNVFDLVSA